MSDKMREKISKLLAKTVAAGCTEDEAESAMRMAASIAAREGIDLSSLRDANAPKPKAKAKRMSEEYKPHQALAAEAAAILYGIECYAYDLGAKGLVFVGREELIESAETTWFWLMGQVEGLYKTHLPKGLTQRDRAEFRKTFKAACAARVRDRAAQLIRQMKTEEAAAQAATGHNALTVMGHFDQLKLEVNEYWDDLTAKWEKRHQEWAEKNPEAAKALAVKEKKRKIPKGRSIPTGNGTNLGFKAGDSVKLREEVR